MTTSARLRLRLTSVIFFGITSSFSIFAENARSVSPLTSNAADANSKIIESKLAFPFPVQWNLNAGNSIADISLIGLAWGSAAEPEMLARATAHPNQKAVQPSNNAYVIALHLEARLPRPYLDMRTRSGLVRIRDGDGNMDIPSDLTPSGFVPNDYDLHFAVGNVTTQFWDFFPVPQDQKEFLFEVHWPAQSALYFKVNLNNHELTIVNSTPQPESACLSFEKVFGGSIGADAVVSIQLKRENAVLSGTEQYAKIGEMRWLTGAVDSLGYFTVAERGSEKTLTGILKGRFDAAYQTMSGYFSKPDGSQLERFEFHQAQLPMDQQNAPQSGCKSEQ